MHKRAGPKQRKVMSIPSTRGSIISTENRDLESWFGRKTIVNTQGSGLKMCLRVLESTDGFQTDKCTMASIITIKCTDLGSRPGPTTGGTKAFIGMI